MKKIVPLIMGLGFSLFLVSCGGPKGKLSFVDSNLNRLSVMDLSSQEVVSLTETYAGGYFSWSPNGRFVAFATRQGEDWYIDVMKEDGTGRNHITRALRSSDPPLWSPNSTRIAFEAVEKSGDYRLLVVNQSGNVVVDIPSPVNSGRKAGYSWSPDSTKLAYIDIQGQLAVMNANGYGEPITLTEDQTSKDWVRWSPDVRTVAFVTTIYEGEEVKDCVQTVNPEKGRRKQLVCEPGEIYGLFWSPDGEKLFYQVTRGTPTAGDYVVKANGRGKTRISPPGYFATEMVWSPDAEWVLMSAWKEALEPGVDPALFLVSADAEKHIRLTDDGIWYVNLAWLK